MRRAELKSVKLDSGFVANRNIPQIKPLTQMICSTYRGNGVSHKKMKNSVLTEYCRSADRLHFTRASGSGEQVPTSETRATLTLNREQVRPHTTAELEERTRGMPLHTTAGHVPE